MKCAHVSQCFPVSNTGNIVSSVSFCFQDTNYTYATWQGILQKIRACEHLHNFCEHEQASTHLIFASNSSKGQILRALSNLMGPFDAPQLYTQILKFPRLWLLTSLKLKTQRYIPFIKFSTSDNAFLAFWWVHPISVTSNYTCFWPYMELNRTATIHFLRIRYIYLKTSATIRYTIRIVVPINNDDKLRFLSHLSLPLGHGKLL